MKRIYQLAAMGLCATSLLLSSCGNNGAKPETGATTDSSHAQKMPDIAIKAASASPEFPNASLEIAGITTAPQGKDSTKVTFNFTVKNYDLKAQTADAAGKGCANSDKGQHIHFIMDDQAYKALYEPKNEVVVANDSKHYVLAFLSRSYHESIKSKGASALVYFHVEKNGKLAKEPTPATPMVFYSRPKGDYLGNDTANVLLDFYVWNTTLQAGECAVKATIENTTRSAIMDTVLRKWQPTIIHNLGSGKCKVTLNLIDKDGKAMEGTQTKVSREFNLVAQEPVAH